MDNQVKKSESADFEELRATMRGDVLLPGDGGYDDARSIWNAMIDRRPAVICKCIGSYDVMQSVLFARKHELEIAVKGGGHNVAGNAVCEGGMMIDLSNMRSVHVNIGEKTVLVGAGCLLGDIDYETQLHGLAVSGGIVSHTGVGGLTLGGGFGWISRKHGLAIDNLISARVVTADGALLTASAQENPELFWGLSGGGGNFGIVTSFEFKCAEVGPTVYSGLVIKRFTDAKAYMQFHAEYVRSLPDEMTVWMFVRHAPPFPFVDESVHGQLIVAVPFVYLGGAARGEALIQPIRDFGKSHGEAIGMNPWTAWQAGFDGLVSHGARNYWKSHHLKELSGECIDNILEYAAAMPTKECEIFIPHMEGVASRVPENATAYTHRKAPFVLNIHTRWREKSQDESCKTWAQDFHKATQPFAGGVYVNFLSDEGEARVAEAYTEATWKRLQKVKLQCDPQNLFHMNQNIKPPAPKTLALQKVQMPRRTRPT